MNPSTIISDISKKIKPTLRKNGILSASVVGSVARGEATKKSDLDLLITYKKNLSLLDLAELQLKLEKKLNCKVDLLSRNYLKPRIKKYILQDEISI
ncbi:MAG: nucleotidyltransferase family protein [Patescibacteria group bacterium]